MRNGLPVALLERIKEIKFDPTVDVPEENEALAKAANEVLGYHALSHEIESQYAAQQTNSLLINLLTLGIHPFTPRSVEKYKTALTKRTSYSARGAAKVAWAFLLFGLSLIAGSIAMAVMYNPNFAWLVGPGFLCAVASGVVLFDIYESAFGRSVEWKRFSMRGYKHPIPKSVVQMAVTIAQTIEGVSLEIEEMVVTQAPKALFDPFLIVTQGKEKYYVAVWGEKDFEAEQLALPVAAAQLALRA